MPEIPSLQALALRAVASAVHASEPSCLGMLPFGGAAEIVEHLAKQGRLRPETLRPLLLSDWSSAEALSSKIGNTLVSAAPGCRGLGALAAQRLQFEQQRRRERAEEPCISREISLPAGTRRSDASTVVERWCGTAAR
jgi:hypothetical protein